MRENCMYGSVRGLYREVWVYSTGVGQDGYIHGGDAVWFGDGMEALCGNVFTVSEFNDIEYRSIEGVENCDDGTYWSICAWMLEPYEDNTEMEVADDNQIALLLS